jgi:hypothetical protein
MELIWGRRKAKYFSKWGWTAPFGNGPTGKSVASATIKIGSWRRIALQLRSALLAELRIFTQLPACDYSA